MIILGLNAYHADSSACLVVDGKLIAAAEEERFNRIKHSAGFPENAIIYCLKEANITIEDVDHIAINHDSKANLLSKSSFALSHPTSYKLVYNRLRNLSKIENIRQLISKNYGTSKKIRAQFHSIEHHAAHLASTFFVSPFDEAAVVSVDGFGDFVSTMWGVGIDNKIEIKHRTFFPHSLGRFYLAFSHYIGFPNYGDEYKVMGLAAYGNHEFMDVMRKIVKTREDGFVLDMDFFVHNSERDCVTLQNGKSRMGTFYSEKCEEVLGPARRKGEEINQRHRNIAASLQKRYEEVFYDLLNNVYEKTKLPNLAIAGGCAMNSVANGKIVQNTPFRKVFIQPAPGDAGGSVGAAYYVWNQMLDKPRSFVLEKPYLGPEFSEREISEQLSVVSAQLKREDCYIEKISDKEHLCRKTAEHIADGKVVGWFQGRMEWGPRALGNRSILCDPRRPEMKDIINQKIKNRESFRPFAPSIHIEAVEEYFEMSSPVPFMLKIYGIRPEKRAIIPAVTHVDGTGRLQTVSKENNSLYWMLIDEFRKITGVPILLNTSFNENEPIVCHPAEALDCFLRTKMDVLVLGNFLIERDDTSGNGIIHNMKVSIITAVLNGRDSIEDCILSIINQNYPDIEYLVIEGGSSDDTFDIIKKV